MLGQIDEYRVSTSRVLLAAALSLFFICSNVISAPALRLGLEGNFTGQDFREYSNTEFNGACYSEFSRDYRCPYRLSAGIRVNSFTYGDLGYLIAGPEVNLKYSILITRKFGMIGGIGCGYFLSNVAEVESGAYGRISAGAIYNPLPILDLRLTLSTIPFKKPEEESFRNFGIGIGISYLFGFPDDDHDWIPNAIDTCSSSPRGVKVDEVGCALDSDGDGVFDGLDRCPDTPFEAFVDKNGCPKDSDDDGVYDGVDRCEDTPRDILVDSLGCPRDSDLDGVPDFADSCAETPQGAIVDENGCPNDSDEDGILDGIDQCPGTPSGFVVNSLGCPFVTPVEEEVIYNAYDLSLNLKAEAMQRIDNIAERMRAYPYRIIEVGVYTDSEGSQTYNINRGYRVAQRVRDVLLARGVTEEQIELKGYGEIDPVGSNMSNEGRQKNRRIVFSYLRSIE